MTQETKTTISRKALITKIKLARMLGRLEGELIRKRRDKMILLAAISSTVTGLGFLAFSVFLWNGYFSS